MLACLATLLAATLAAPLPAATLRGEALVKHAQLEYRLGDFAGALTELTQAYELAPAPLLLYDIALCHRALHEPRRTEFFLRKYLAASPNGASARRAREILGELAAEPPAPMRPPPIAASPVKAHPDAAATALATPVPQPRVARGPYFLAGGGLAALGAGTLLGVLASTLRGSDRLTFGTGGPFHSLTYPEFESANREAVAADVLFAVGGALLASSIVWALAGHRAPAKEAP